MLDDKTNQSEAEDHTEKSVEATNIEETVNTSTPVEPVEKITSENEPITVESNTTEANPEVETEAIADKKALSKAVETEAVEPEAVESIEESTETIPEVEVEAEQVESTESTEASPEVEKPAVVEEKAPSKAAKPKSVESTEAAIEVTNEAVNEAPTKAAPVTSEKEETPEKTKNKDVSSAEKSDEKPAVTAPDEVVDYSTLSLEELIANFQKEIKNEIPKIKKHVEEIKSNFNKKFGKLRQEKKEAFLKDGGNEIDFQYSNPFKSAFNDLLFEYKTKRESHYKQIEQEQKENLQKRLDLIEALKHLIDNAEPDTMYTEFRGLQDKWRTIGKIPHSQYNDVWRTYDHHVERFYDLLHLRNDFRDLDFKHNLEEKIKLAEKAEELAEQDDSSKAFRELQVLHKMWKEDIGPVAREFREDIWDRFSNATKKIHEKRHELQKVLESKFEENVDIKRVVIAKISTILSDQVKESHKFWQQKIKELEAYRKEYFAIGKVPRALSDQIWDEFKASTRDFNKRKNAFYKNIKREQHDNLEKKKALVQKAEDMKESDDWDLTTEVMKQIQAEWKNVGHVPRKYSDKLWKQFKGACNHYFDRLHQQEDEGDAVQIESFNRKKELLEQLKGSDEEMTMEKIKTINNQWHSLGQLPHNMKHLEAKFSKVINGMYGKMDLDAAEIAMLKFKNVIDHHLSENNYRKIDNEKIFVRKKMDEVSKEIQQLETNISFFSNADPDNPLFKGVSDNIEKYNEQLITWKMKMDYLSRLDY